MRNEAIISRFLTEEEAAAESKEESVVQFPQIPGLSDEARMSQVLAGYANKGDLAAPLSIPRGLDRNQLKQAFEDAFQLLGGVPRLVLWGDQNYGDFIKIFGRMLPTSAKAEIEHSGGIVVNHVLRKGALDE